MADNGTTHVRIRHRGSGELIADGPLGWGIAAFEGNYYVSSKHLKTKGFRSNFIPGLCFYKFFYVWLDFVPCDGDRVRGLGWRYILPNPLLPFIAFRVAVPGVHPDILVEKYAAGGAEASAG